MKLHLFLESCEVLGWFSCSYIKLFINNNNTQESIFLHCLQALNLLKFSLNYFNDLLTVFWLQPPNKQWSSWVFLPEDGNCLPHWALFTIRIRKQTSCSQSGVVVKYMTYPNLVFSMGLWQGSQSCHSESGFVSFCHESSRGSASRFGDKTHSIPFRDKAKARNH